MTILRRLLSFIGLRDYNATRRRFLCRIGIHNYPALRFGTNYCVDCRYPEWWQWDDEDGAEDDVEDWP